MARPRTPAALLELRGAFKKDPQRRREEPAANGPVGGPPPSFDAELQAVWEELVGLVPSGVLSRADRWTAEVACRMMHQLRNGDIKAAEIGILQSCLSRMGMTPADRSRIAIPEETPEIDELGALAAEGLAVAGERLLQ